MKADVDAYYHVPVDDDHRHSYRFVSSHGFYLIFRTDYLRNERGSWDNDTRYGTGTTKLFEGRDYDEARRRYDEIIASEPRAIHASKIPPSGEPY